MRLTSNLCWATVNSGSSGTSKEIFHLCVAGQVARAGQVAGREQMPASTAPAPAVSIQLPQISHWHLWHNLVEL